ncbi:MAG: SDR family NAD(P)-dependent oxidoreductase [Steroidobacteraceae bacterium]
MKHPRSVLITGASGGIGAALARCYAEPGRTLILHGRDAARLEAISQTCKVQGARIETLTFDVRNPDATIEQLQSLSQREVIDLAIVNAGVTQAIGGGEIFESFTTAHEVLAVNLEGALATVAGVLPEMIRRGSGQIALVSSLAAYVGLPRTPAYCASKAALKTYGESLRLRLAPHGVAVSIVLPGFVRTAMTDRVKGPKPAIIPPERAALLIRRGLERNRGRIAFPRRLAWGLRLISMLPQPLSERILRGLGFGR